MQKVRMQYECERHHESEEAKAASTESPHKGREEEAMTLASMDTAKIALGFVPSENLALALGVWGMGQHSYRGCLVQCPGSMGCSYCPPILHFL